MKKSTVAVGVIIALGVVWTGGAWYTGKQLEKNVEAVIKKANAYSSDKTGIPFNSTIKDYQRGLFSTHFILDIAPDKSVQVDKSKAGRSLQVDVVVDHGPFPLARIGSGNILPAMAAAKLELLNNEVTKPLFNAAKGKSPINAQIDIAYDRATSSKLTILPIEFTSPQEDHIKFEGGNYHLNTNSKMDAFDVEGKLGKFTFSNAKSAAITVSEVAFSGHQKKTAYDFMTGEQTLNFGKIDILVKGELAGSLANLNLKGKADLTADGNKLNASAEYALTSLNVKGQDFGSGKIGLDFVSLDAAAFNDFMKVYRQLGKEILQSSAAQQEDPDYMRKQIETVLLPHVVKLKKGEPEVKWLVSWKNQKGEATFNLDIHAADGDKVLDASASETAAIDSQLKSLNTKLVLPADMAIEAGKKGLMVQGKSEVSATQQVTQAVNGLVGLGSMFKLITLENNTVKMDVQYSQGYITLNGKKMTVDEFRQQYGRLGSLH